MFKIKRPAIIGLLIVLLVFTGYWNHQLTQQALRKTSKEYQNHEADEKEKFLSENQIAKNEDDKEKVEIELEDNKKDKDSNVKEKEENVDQILKSSNKETEEALSKEVSAGSANYFVEYRLSRDKLRANSIDRLNEIVNNSNTGEKMREEAQAGVIKIGNTSEKELQIEGLIKSKGFSDALVFLTEEDVKVVVSSEELEEQDMVKILDIVKSETEYDVNNIKIMKKQ